MGFYNQREEGGIVILELNENRATVLVSRDFKENFLRLIESNVSRNFILDFSKVEFVDSSFIGALVSGLKKITNMKGDLKLVGLQPSVRVMFELTRLNKVFEIFDNIADAQTSYL